MIDSRITSRGGFTINNQALPPASAGTISGYPRPNIRMNGDICVVTNSEILNTLQTSAASAQGLNQALIPGALPWLNGVAVNFSKWRWLRYRLIYVPSCPTTTPGAVTFCILYDTNDAGPATRLDAAASHHSISAPYWAGWEGAELLNNHSKTPVAGSVSMEVDVRRVGKPWFSYITPTNYAALTQIDRNIYSPGLVLGITDGGPATSVAGGTVFVQYTIELIEPIAASVNR